MQNWLITSRPGQSARVAAMRGRMAPDRAPVTGADLAGLACRGVAPPGARTARRTVGSGVCVLIFRPVRRGPPGRQGRRRLAARRAPGRSATNEPAASGSGCAPGLAARFREDPQLAEEPGPACRSRIRLGVRDALIQQPDPGAAGRGHDRDVVNPAAVRDSESDPARRIPDHGSPVQDGAADLGSGRPAFEGLVVQPDVQRLRAGHGLGHRLGAASQEPVRTAPACLLLWLILRSSSQTGPVAVGLTARCA